MGSLKSDYIKRKEARQQLSRVKFLRSTAEKASDLQINYLVALGKSRGWAIEPLLNCVVGDVVPTWARTEIKGFGDLTRNEASHAIDRMKAGRYGKTD